MKRSHFFANAINRRATPAVWMTLAASSAPPPSSIATSESSDQYRAQFAMDGKIPGAGLRDDAGQAWCLRGDSHRHIANVTKNAKAGEFKFGRADLKRIRGEVLALGEPAKAYSRYSL